MCDPVPQKSRKVYQRAPHQCLKGTWKLESLHSSPLHPKKPAKEHVIKPKLHVVTHGVSKQEGKVHFYKCPSRWKMVNKSQRELNTHVRVKHPNFHSSASIMVWSIRHTMQNLNTKGLTKHLHLYALLKGVGKDIIMSEIWTNINVFIQRTCTHALHEVVLKFTQQKVI